MNKAELVSAMADKANLSKKDAETALKAFTDVTGRNPQTGKEMTIPASKAPKFKAGKALKDMINA